MNEGADLIIRNAAVSTMNRAQTEASAVAIRAGKIVAVADDAEVMRHRASATRVVDANKRRLIPGLIDSHIHLIRGGLNFNLELRWEGVTSLADAMAMLKEQAARTPPPQWVRVVGGFTEHQFVEKRLPTLAEVNAAAPHTPVFILHLYDRVLLRAAAFFIFASAYWALLPLIARRELGGSAAYYGIVLASIGAGAVAGAVLLPKWRARFSAEVTLRTGTALTAAVLVALALLRDQVLAVVAMALAGAAWIAVLTTANTAAQTALPNWVRGRGLAIYLTVFFGAMTAGSLIWGQLADSLGVRPALGAAAALGFVSLLVAWWAPIADAERDLTPSMHWPEPAFALDASTDAPVMVSIEYHVDAADRQAFLEALHALAAERRRDGATFWQVWEDAAAPGRFSETFVEPSWQEHMRHHHRVTVADADVQVKVASFHRGDGPPAVVHWVMSRPADPA